MGISPFSHLLQKIIFLGLSRASLVAQIVEHLPAMWEIRVRFLGWEDPLEKEMATHSSTLTWKIPWSAEPGRLQFMGHKESDITEKLHFLLHDAVFIFLKISQMHIACVVVAGRPEGAGRWMSQTQPLHTLSWRFLIMLY